MLDRIPHIVVVLLPIVLLVVILLGEDQLDEREEGLLGSVQDLLRCCDVEHVLGEDRIHESLDPAALLVAPKACKQLVQGLAGKELEHLLHASLLGNCLVDLGDVVDDVWQDGVRCHGVQDVQVLVFREAVRLNLLVFVDAGLRLILLRPLATTLDAEQECQDAVLLDVVVKV